MKAETGVNDPVEKVRRFLDEWGYTGRIHTSAETIFTVEDASRTVGAPPEAILKTIVLQADGEFVLALMSGVNKVDLKTLKRLLPGVKKVSMSNPETVYGFSGFSVGGVPPVGYPAKLKTFLDEDLFSQETVWAAAGSEHAFFPVTPCELLEMTDGERAGIKKEGKGEATPSPG